MMKLFLRTNCPISDTIRDKMEDHLWQLVQVEYVQSTEPFLQDGESIIRDPIKIINYLELQSSSSPSLITQLKTAKTAATKAYKHALKTGTIKAPTEVIDHRRTICQKCPFRKRSFLMEYCKRCGCSIRTKTATLSESCPIKKW